MAIIDFMNGSEMQEAIQSASQAVSGMSAAEAAAALGATQIGSNGVTKITTFPLLGGNNFKPVTVEAQAASNAWTYYKTAAEAAGITSFGAAAGAVAKWANGVLFGTGQGTLAATGGLLTMSAPAAAAAIAPLFGVALGGALYESNPDLWEKISRTILPFCYDDTETVPAVVDENGQVYVDKALAEALRDLFEEEGIGADNGKNPPQGLTLRYQTPIASSAGGGTRSTDIRDAEISGPGNYFGIDGNSSIYGFTTGPGASFHYTVKFKNGSVSGEGNVSMNSTYTYDGRTVYYDSYPIVGSYQGGSIPRLSRVTGTTPNNEDIVKAGWITCYGDSTGEGFPEGTSEWTGTIPQTLPEIPVIIIVEDPVTGLPVEVPYTPIQLPGSEPGIVPVEPDPDAPLPWETPDPEEDPSKSNPQAPTTWPEIGPWIDPFIPWQFPEPVSPTDPTIDPTKAPVPNPVNRPEPYVDPEPNPEQQPEPLPDPKPVPMPDPRTWPDNPVTPDPPPSTGESPPSIPPFVDWPSIVPADGADVSGLIHVYNPTSAEFQGFGRWLWVTWHEITLGNLEKLWNNPFDGVIGAMELYCTPVTGASEGIRSGFLQSTVSAKTVPQRYITINCGSIVIPEYWKNYLDYAPYTKAYIYLPFIGIVEIESDDIVGHAINVTYHVDCYNGSCIAQVTVARDDYCNTVYQYSGNCAVDIPMAGGTQASIRAGMIQAAAWGISSVIGGLANAAGSLGVGNVAGAVGQGVSGVAYGAAQALNSLVSAKSSVQHSGTFGASYGAMGIKIPYIIIRRPIQKIVDNYNKDYGFPAHKMVQIGTCSGYLRVREVNVISPTASNEEKAMIEQYLKTGVYVTDE